MSDPVPDGGFDECKRYALEHVDLRDFHLKRMLKTAFVKASVADIIVSMAMRDDSGVQRLRFDIVKNRENTGNRRLFSFQGSGTGAPFYTP